MAFILDGTFKILDIHGSIGMKLREFIELTVIFSTFGRKSRPKVSLPNTLLVLFRHENLPDDKEHDLESNELCTNLGNTKNTDKRF